MSIFGKMLFGTGLIDIMSAMGILSIFTIEVDPKQIPREAFKCSFKNELKEDEFHSIASNVLDKYAKVESYYFDGTKIYITIESRSGYTVWNCNIDFNDYGNITGNYWVYSDNNEANLPERIASIISKQIINHINTCNLTEEERLEDERISSEDRQHSLDRERKRLEKEEERIREEREKRLEEERIREENYRVYKENQREIESQRKREEKYREKELRKEEKRRERELKKEEKEQRKKELRAYHFAKYGKYYVCFIILVIISLGLFGAYEVKQYKQRKLDEYNEKYTDLIKLSYYYSDLSEKNYEEANQLLKEEGFTNITLSPKYDVYTGFLTKAGTIESITIDGSDAFNKGDWIEPDAEIVITYHEYVIKQWNND